MWLNPGWRAWAAMAAATAAGCTTVLGINKDYYPIGAGGAGGGAPSSSNSSVSTGGAGPSSSNGSSNTTTSSAGSGGGGSGGGFPAPTWAVSFGGVGADRVGHPGIAIGPALDVFITGIFTNSIDLGGAMLSHPGTGFFLAKLDSTNGKGVWSTVLGDSTGTVSSLAATPDGGVVVAGSFNPMLTLSGMLPVLSLGGHDMFVAKFDASGACQWHHEYGDGQEQYANAVAVGSNGIIYLAGSFKGTFMMGNTAMSTPIGTEAAYVAKFDATGNCLWAQQFGDNAQATSLSPLTGGVGGGIAVGGMFSGTIVLGGGKTISSMTPSPYILALSATPIPVTLASFPGADITLGDDTAFTGGALFGITSSGGPNANMALGALDMDGKVSQPPTVLSGTSSGTIESVARHSIGDIFLAGSYAGGSLNLGKPIQNHGAQDIFIARLGQMGSLIGGAGYGDVAPQFGRNVRSDFGGHLYIFGDFQGVVDFGQGPLLSKGDYDMFLVKFDPAVFALH